MLAPGMRAEVGAILGDVVEADASRWLARGTYPGDFLEIPLDTHAPLTYRMVAAAASLTCYVADRLRPAGPPDGSVGTLPASTGGLPPHAAAETTMARRVAIGVTEALRIWNPDATTPTAVMGCSPLPESSY